MKIENNITLHRPESIHLRPNLPISKSIASRVMMIEQIIGSQSSFIDNHRLCDDLVVLKRGLSSTENLINIEASGTALRFLTAYYAITEGKHILTGSKRLQERPIAPLIDALRQLGAKIEYIEKEDFCPLKITGRKLSGGTVSIDGSISSQFISALLLIAPTLEKGLTINITNSIVSKSYIDLTISVMKDFGAEVSWKDSKTIEVLSKPYVYIENYTIEKDWTAASYWFALKALAEHLGIPCIADIDSWGLNNDSLQGDVIVPSLIEECLKSNYFEFDFTSNIDLVPTMTVLCHALNKPYNFTGIETLRIKESDRLIALKQELSKLNTPTMKRRWSLASYSDHRIAMSLSILSLVFPEITIEDKNVVNKSYPNYWDDLNKSYKFNIKKQAKAKANAKATNDIPTEL